MKKQLSLLVDLRPALQGFAGIPQETRLLFRGFCLDGDFEIDGLLQMHSASLEPGILPNNTSSEERWGTARNFHSLARVVISISEEAQSKNRTVFEVVRDWIGKRLRKLKLVYGTVRIELGRFETRHYEDFVWRYLFSKTLSPSDFALVTSKNHRVCPVSWDDMQEDGLDTLPMSSTAKYPELNTSGYDVFIAQTPYPGRVSAGTTMIIRYHDAIPIFLPHTITGKREHEAIHFYALMSNVEAGAWFSCVSEASRQDLLRVFPEAAERAVTIYNMVSPQYFIEASKFEEARKIIPLRKSPLINSHDDETNDCTSAIPELRSAIDRYSLPDNDMENEFRYLLVVSTIDPRKNHATCIAAWQTIKRTKDPSLKLILVGSLGSDYNYLAKDLTREMSSGGLFLLDSVPANELRVLYHHAAATICPSFAEGFDFSGIEAMRCGGIVVASDIAVHREIYEDAAEYFDPYSSDSAIMALSRVLYDSGSEQVQSNLRKRGEHVSARYLPENIMPKWRDFLEKVCRR